MSEARAGLSFLLLTGGAGERLGLGPMDFLELAGRPLLWHIYQQEEGAHWEKLGAFLDSYCAALTDQAASALRALWSAWNGKGDMAQAWQGLAEHGEQLAAHAEHWCQEQASRPDLAAALVQFHRNWLSCAA